MCDTVVAVGKATKDGSVILGKNSNRLPNEAHNIEYIKGKKHKANSKVDCTYISVPQVEQTFDVLLLKPFWMFGCEMGANEHGVTIGNEAVYSKEPIRDTGLLGMDLMRLALERESTAKKALETITTLLEKYGQGGPCSYNMTKRNYHNSFIIADKEEAWVLETADKYWIAEKVKDIRSISNTLTIEKEYDFIHPDLIKHAVEKGYSKSTKEFSFARDFIPKFRVYHALSENSPRSHKFTKGSKRLECTTKLMLSKKGKITPKDVMDVLRNHNITAEEEKKWSSSRAKAKSPCHHATNIALPDQTAGSSVSHIMKDMQVHWVTGSSIPCISTYKPIYLPKPGLQTKLKPSDGTYNSEGFWWINEKFQRLVNLDYRNRMSSFKEERDALEEEFLKKTEEIIKTANKRITEETIEKMAQISNEAFDQSIKKVSEWIKKIEKMPVKVKTGLIYRNYWNKQNRKAKLDV